MGMPMAVFVLEDGKANPISAVAKPLGSAWLVCLAWLVFKAFSFSFHTPSAPLWQTFAVHANSAPYTIAY